MILEYFTLKIIWWVSVCVLLIGFAVVVFLPIVLAYTSWVYRVMRGKLTEEKIRRETHSVY